MAKEYAVYPFEHMNITQRYNQGNHIPHWKGSKNYSDKPWDEACKDSGRSYFVPQNDFKVEEVIGLGNNITNTVRLKSVNKLTMPNGKIDYLKLTLTHMEESNLRQVQKGQILKKGTKVLLEGKDGVATGNHFHITANTGKYYGLLQNSNGAWCYTYAKSLLPEQAFYLDSKFTKVVNKNGITFKNKPVLNVYLLDENKKTLLGYIPKRTVDSLNDFIADQKYTVTLEFVGGNTKTVTWENFDDDKVVIKSPIYKCNVTIELEDE